jgi:uncharacterized protein YbjQ (UPF0145 family)/ssDNA-specific exonuclease RecJ
MTNLKDILVTTTATIEGVEIKKYIKPVSAHIVAGTNAFSDIFASISDVFGGRSQTYQKQLSSLYTEAIEKIKISAYEAGGNCIIGLTVDLDEIAGKGKSMFMITAIGTAVTIDYSSIKPTENGLYNKVGNISAEKIKVLQRKKEVILAAEAGSLALEDDTWQFITNNQISEVYNFVLSKFQKAISAENEFPETYNKFNKHLLEYIDSLPDINKYELLYKTIVDTDNVQLLSKAYKIISDLQLLDLSQVREILNSVEFHKQKRGTLLFNSDKPFYNKEDISFLEELAQTIKTKFPEKGNRSFKKQLLSSKEKEVWTCECGKSNDIDAYCSNCKTDIFGFTTSELSPNKAVAIIDEKICLLKDSLR